MTKKATLDDAVILLESYYDMVMTLDDMISNIDNDEALETIDKLQNLTQELLEEYYADLED